MTQLGHYLGRPIVHTIELLDWATGGPKPAVLEGVTLREPAPIAQAQTETAASTGIW
jgi:glycolate oxidase iron-sulfur subunit